MIYQLIAAAAPTQPPFWVQMAPMALILLVFYVVWFLPMQKKQKAVADMRAGLKKGDKVVTSGGLYGEVMKVDGDIVALKLAENVKVRVAKWAISQSADSAEDNGGK